MRVRNYIMITLGTGLGFFNLLTVTKIVVLPDSVASWFLKPFANRMSKTQRLSCDLFLAETATANFRNITSSGNNGVWEWYHFSSPGGHKTNDVLVAQFSGHNPQYLELMNTAVPVHKAYAAKWNYDFVTVEGSLIGCLDWHSSWNKVTIIAEAIMRGYKTLLLMDADCIIVNLDVPMTSLFQPQTMITAQRSASEEPVDINIGLMAINLQHPKLPEVLDKWYQLSTAGLRASAASKDAVRVNADDQTMLHDSLRFVFPNAQQMATAVNRTNGIFQYRDGTFVKHFIREGKFKRPKGWDAHSSSSLRLEAMAKQAALTTQTFAPYFS